MSPDPSSSRPVRRPPVKSGGEEQGEHFGLLVYAIGLAAMLLGAAIVIDLGRAAEGQSRLETVMHLGAVKARLAARVDQFERWVEESRKSPETKLAEAVARRRQIEGRTARLPTDDRSPDASRGGSGSPGPSSPVMPVAVSDAGQADLPVGPRRKEQPPKSIELALVLDTSRAVDGARLERLKASATRIVERLLDAQSADGSARIAVVPFAAAVNVGPARAGEPWLDQAAGVSALAVGGQASPPAMSLFKALGTPWAGCVMARPAPFDTTDDRPERARPATLFTPMFAPDEPDEANSGGNAYANSYIPDESAACPARARVCAATSRRGECVASATESLDPPTAQGLLCKYREATFAPSAGKGPNAPCTSAPIVPLSAEKAPLVAAIEALTAAGDANIAEGVMWGWRALSPEPPLTEARPYGVEGHVKLMVVISAGESSYSTAANHNRSSFGAYGFAAEGRLGTDENAAGLALRLDSRLVSACENAKAAGIKIATIDLRLPDEAGLDSVLGQCASEAGLAVALGNPDGRATELQSLAKLLPRTGKEG